MISKVLYSLFFSITMMEAMGTSLTLTEKIDPHSYITPILKNNTIDQAYKVIKYIRNQKLSLQPHVYHEILTWCLQNKKIDLAITLVQKIPSRTFIQEISPSISLVQSLLKDAIILQITPLISALIEKIPSRFFEKYILHKDTTGHSLFDYAQQTQNQNIINMLDFKTVREERSIFNSIIRGIGCFITVVIVIPVIIYAMLGLIFVAINGYGFGVILIYGAPILFPATVLFSILSFTKPVSESFGLEPA